MNNLKPIRVSEMLDLLRDAERSIRQVVGYDDCFDRDMLTTEEATRLSLAAYSCHSVRSSIERYFNDHRRLMDDAA